MTAKQHLSHLQERTRLRAEGMAIERARVREEMLIAMNGPGIDWSDVDQVQALIDRIVPEAKG